MLSSTEPDSNVPNLSKIRNPLLCPEEISYLENLYNTYKIIDSFSSEVNDLREKINKVLESTEEGSDLPNLSKIRKAKITEMDRKKAEELYNIYLTEEIYSHEWYTMIRKINKLVESEFSDQTILQSLNDREKSIISIRNDVNKDLKYKIFQLNTDDKIKNKLYQIYYEMLSSAGDELKTAELANKLQWYTKLPFNTIKPLVYDNVKTFCRQVYDVLDKELYGMKKVKEKVLQIINDQLRNGKKQKILALKGPPGTGKTKISKTIAKALGLPFDMISLGGSSDNTIFKGSSKVWVGSNPSLLLEKIANSGYANSVILLDEIDKLSGSRGLEIEHSLLHVLDPQQNKEFTDLFLCEVPHDISETFFIVSMNTDELNPALLDRLNIIEIPAYEKKELTIITRDYVLPAALKEKGMKKGDITITDKAIDFLLDNIGETGGVRKAEQWITNTISNISLYDTLGRDTVELSFKVPGFKGFPYEIDEKRIVDFIKKKDVNDKQATLYM